MSSSKRASSCCWWRTGATFPSSTLPICFGSTANLHLQSLASSSPLLEQSFPNTHAVHGHDEGRLSRFCAVLINELADCVFPLEANTIATTTVWCFFWGGDNKIGDRGSNFTAHQLKGGIPQFRRRINGEMEISPALRVYCKTFLPNYSETMQATKTGGALRACDLGECGATLMCAVLKRRRCCEPRPESRQARQ